jgi:hypothetical protein
VRGKLAVKFGDPPVEFEPLRPHLLDEPSDPRTEPRVVLSSDIRNCPLCDSKN